jgi:hypothetical protein
MNFVPAVIGRQIARSTLIAQKNSPGILFGAGVVGMVGSTVLACRATLKVEAVLDEAKEKIDMTNSAILDHPEKYNDSDRRRDVTVIRVQTGVKLLKLYAPAIIVGGVGIACLTRSHSILNKRNAALTAAYGALEKGFNEYRARVVDKYGEEQDRDFRYGTREVLVRDETGEEMTVTRVQVDDKPSIYARFFDDGSASWNPVAEYNLLFLQCQQNYANDMLKARGHVLLNDVYRSLGLPDTKAGCVVGWVLNNDGSGDNHIDFGVFDGQTPVARDFVNGFEGAILLDFNVDGLIYDKI